MHTSKIDSVVKQPAGHRPMAIAAILTSLLLAMPLSADEGLPLPFEASFELIRNGKTLGEAHFGFQRDAARWTLSSRSKGTKGLARFLGLDEESQSEGTWHEGNARPERFEQTIKVAIKTLRTTAVFDWDKLTVVSEHKDGTSTLKLEAGVLDPTSLGLAIRSGLARQESEWRLPLVDEDEIEEQHYRAAKTIPLQTPLGCLTATKVERIRGPESKRYTNTWYATELNHVPVFIEHGKQDGDHLETRLVALSIDGKVIARRPDCKS